VIGRRAIRPPRPLTFGKTRLSNFRKHELGAGADQMSCADLFAVNDRAHGSKGASIRSPRTERNDSPVPGVKLDLCQSLLFELFVREGPFLCLTTMRSSVMGRVCFEVTNWTRLIFWRPFYSALLILCLAPEA
jgi:hypothetical protein